MNDFKNQSPWGSPHQAEVEMVKVLGEDPHSNVDEIIQKIQDKIKRFFPGGASGGKPIILGLVIFW